MAYRYEKEENGKQALVIDGWEKGIASSPYLGIGNMRNLGIKYYPGIAYVNYKRLQGTAASMGIPIIGGYTINSNTGIIYFSDNLGHIYKQNSLNSTTFTDIGSEPAGAGSAGIQFWNNYLITFSTGGEIDICGNGTGDGGVTSSNWNTATSSSGVWPIKNATVTLTGSPAAGDTSAVISSYTDAQGTSRAFWNGPTGQYNVRIGGVGGEIVEAQLTQGQIAVSWTTPLQFNSGNSSMLVYPVGTGTTPNSQQSIISINNGNLYFCNGLYVGAFYLSPSGNSTFTKGNMTTFQFSSGVVQVPNGNGNIVWLEELLGQLIIATSFSLITWNEVSPFPTSAIPIQEQIYQTINILNNLFVFAGNKGNIFYSNGYSISLFTKLPDYIAGVIDPQWVIGGVMAHRQRLWFQATAFNSNTGQTLLAGIFSVSINSGVATNSIETTGALTIESQNSFGLTTIPINTFTFTGVINSGSTSGTLTGNWNNISGIYQILFSNGDIRNATFTNSSTSVTWLIATSSNSTATVAVSALPSTNGLLIDNPIGNLSYDNYYSVWGGLSGGGIDYNNTTLWSSNEPTIETDIIPIGTFLFLKTFENMEFKLDQPMQNGDSITVYARKSLSDSYIQVGTTSTNVLSAKYPQNFPQWQWVQFKITLSCNSSASISSFMRLREIRIR